MNPKNIQYGGKPKKKSVSPKFDASMVEKEISAVNSEWLLLRQSDQFVVNRVTVNTTNPNHPKSQLGVGNNETLSRDKEILLSSLREFYNQYYSANLMKLVLVGNQSQRELKSYAKNAEFFWCQEEPKNMGAWFSVRDYIQWTLDTIKANNNKISYIGRSPDATPATGYAKRHVSQQKEIISKVFE